MRIYNFQMAIPHECYYAVKYFVESKGAFNNEWVLAAQLIPMNEDVPLPKMPEDIPEKGVKAWIKLVSRRQKLVTIRKVECKFRT